MLFSETGDIAKDFQFDTTLRIVLMGFAADLLEEKGDPTPADIEDSVRSARQTIGAMDEVDAELKAFILEQLTADNLSAGVQKCRECVPPTLP